MGKAILDSGIVEINPYCGEKRPAQFYYIDLDAVTAGELTKYVIVSKAEAPSRAQRLLKVNDILFQTVRPYQQNNYLFSKERELRTVASTGYAQMRTENNPMYIYYSLHQDEFVREVNNRATGSNYPAINPTELGRCSIYFEPDHIKQDKIAAVLTAADEAIAASRALVEKYAAIKQGLMRDLLTGKGPQTKFSEIVDPISRKGSANGQICINMDCVESGTGELLPIIDSENASAKTAFSEGDVLFGKLRPYLRKYWLATFNGVCSSELMVFRAKPNVRRQYLYYIVSSNEFIEYNNSQTYGTKMPRTSWSIIKKFKTSVPILSEQDQIIEVLTAADERLNTEREWLTKLEHIKRGLMDDLLTNKISTDKLQGGI